MLRSVLARARPPQRWSRTAMAPKQAIERMPVPMARNVNARTVRILWHQDSDFA